MDNVHRGPEIAGISIKKQFGQHFLRNPDVLERMLNAVTLAPNCSIFEIGCGDGVLTRAILSRNIGRLWVFEIDPDWAGYVRKEVPDRRLTIFEENILAVNWHERLEQYAPWILLANLPYQITFPILHIIQQHRKLIAEGVIMVQDEVAEKIMQQSGRGYGYISLFFQHYFSWKSLARISPKDFFPPPKVHSRIIHFRPRTDAPEIPHETEFWRFIKACFHQPRRTLRNNLGSYHYDISKIDAHILGLRAQQLAMSDFLNIWAILEHK